MGCEEQFDTTTGQRTTSASEEECMLRYKLLTLLKESVKFSLETGPCSAALASEFLWPYLGPFSSAWGREETSKVPGAMELKVNSISTCNTDFISCNVHGFVLNYVATVQ